MTVNIGTSNSLEQIRAQQEAAKKAKEAAEKAKAEAAQKDAEAAAAVLKEDAEAELAEAQALKEANDVDIAQEKVNSCNIRVNTAQSAYTNALNQLSQAQSSGDENAIVNAQSAVDRAYNELKTAQKEAEAAQKQLEKESQESIEAQKKAETERAEADKARIQAQEAQEALVQAENNLTTATQALLEADAALAEAEKAAAAEETESAEGVQEADHLSQEEIDSLVKEEGYVYITSKEQFLQIFQSGEIQLDGNYILGCDIDLSDIENWTPVGDEKNPFIGKFNGNNYSIDNLTINVTEDNAQNIGFFGVVADATIENINFTNATINTPDDFIGGSSGVGIVAGKAGGTSFNNITVSGSVSGYESVGGVVGILDDTLNYEVELPSGAKVFKSTGNSSFSNVDTAVDTQGKYYIGGLIGYVESSGTAEATRDLKISNCHTSGNIVFSEESAGGFIGEAGKTIITINNCTNSTNITWDNEENDGNLSFLMETGRAGGFIGCANGTYIAICNSENRGNINVDGDFKGDYYGWYMNDAHVTTYELSGGLPIDDILNIDGIDALTPIVDPATGVSHYEVTVSTLTGLDKMVTMIQANPALADIVTFNVNFDFEAMDGMYDASAYAQYGVTQHLYEDEEGNVHNDVYIDNEIDVETTFHTNVGHIIETDTDVKVYKPTMVSGLLKNSEGAYVVLTRDGEKQVNMNFDTTSQVTSVTKRLEKDEVNYREHITMMVWYYQQQMHAMLKQLYELKEDLELPAINKAEYKKLIKMQEAGMELSNEQKAAIAAFELDTKIGTMVANATNNKGCGMGGNTSFLDKTKAIHMMDEEGRPLFTTLNGDELRQRMDEEGNLMIDDEGNPVYEYYDGRDYDGFADIFAQRGYPKTDEDGNFLYSDPDGNPVTQFVDEEGNISYKNADGSDFEGAEEDLKQELNPYSNSEEYNNLQNEMKELLEEVKNMEA